MTELALYYIIQESVMNVKITRSIIITDRLIIFRSQSATLWNIGILMGIDTQTTWENVVNFNSVSKETAALHKIWFIGKKQQSLTWKP